LWWKKIMKIGHYFYFTNSFLFFATVKLFYTTFMKLRSISMGIQFNCIYFW
jgi:hypothetical protein